MELDAHGGEVYLGVLLADQCVYEHAWQDCLPYAVSNQVREFQALHCAGLRCIQFVIR